jgi:hypothetical protein
MASEQEGSSPRQGLSAHILSASVVMIGVSTALIGLVKVAKAHMGPSRVAQYAGLAAALFLLSDGASYLSIRYSDRVSFRSRCERIADQLFVCGLVGIAAIAVLFAYELI